MFGVYGPTCIQQFRIQLCFKLYFKVVFVELLKSYIPLSTQIRPIHLQPQRCTTHGRILLSRRNRLPESLRRPPWRPARHDSVKTVWRQVLEIAVRLAGGKDHVALRLRSVVEEGMGVAGNWQRWYSERVWREFKLVLGWAFWQKVPGHEWFVGKLEMKLKYMV